jgi:hypothetical protein
MGINHTQLHRRGSVSEPTLWADDPSEDGFSLFNDVALRDDEPVIWAEERADDVQMLLEENARLRGLLIQLSDLIRKNGVSVT